MTTSLDLTNLTLRYGETVAVDDVTLAVNPSEVLAILGPSGCGKTSLLRLIAGFESPESGTIRIGSETVVSREVNVPPEKRRVGMLFQHSALFPHLRVAENIAFGVHGQGAADTVADATRLANLGGLERRYPHELSGGQQQRVALARAIAARPRVMLLDEPFSSLDAQMRQSVRQDVLQILRDEAITTILVTHDQEEALSSSDRVAVMHQGRIVQVSSPSELYRKPKSELVASFVGDGRLVNGVARNGEVVTPLGWTFRSSAPDGSLQILLRPEELRIGAHPGLSGTVKSTRFFGHDQMVEVDVGSTTISIRCDSSVSFHEGEMTTVALATAMVLGFRDGETYDLTFVG